MTRIRVVSTPDGHRLEASHVIAASPEDAWDLLVDTQRWPEWSPAVSGVEATDRRIRTGTTGRVSAPGFGLWLPFEITSCADRRWTWRVARLPGAGHRVEELDESRCRVVFELPLHATGYAPVSLRALERLEELLADDRGASR